MLIILIWKIRFLVGSTHLEEEQLHRGFVCEGRRCIKNETKKKAVHKKKEDKNLEGNFHKKDGKKVAQKRIL